MVLALALAAVAVFALSRFSGRSPAAMVLILVLLGAGWFVFQRVQNGVMGGLSKQVGG